MVSQNTTPLTLEQFVLAQLAYLKRYREWPEVAHLTSQQLRELYNDAGDYPVMLFDSYSYDPPRVFRTVLKETDGEFRLTRASGAIPDCSGRRA
jgi:hypothetical protein